jgi:hypothetical protein
MPIYKEPNKPDAACYYKKASIDVQIQALSTWHTCCVKKVFLDFHCEVTNFTSFRWFTVE